MMKLLYLFWIAFVATRLLFRTDDAAIVIALFCVGTVVVLLPVALIQEAK